MRTYTAEELVKNDNTLVNVSPLVDDFQEKAFINLGFASPNKHIEEWCNCVYYAPIGGGRNLSKGMCAYEHCEYCFGYGVPPIAWSELNK